MKVHDQEDRAMVRAEVGDTDETRDEISQFEDLRSVGSSEAAWCLLSYPIADRFPNVLALRVHLQDQHQVVFDEDSETEVLERQRDTELTAFFKFNEQSTLDPLSLPKYVEMPKKHWYDKSKKTWKVRKQKVDSQIGRVHSVNPVAGSGLHLELLYFETE